MGVGADDLRRVVKAAPDALHVTAHASPRSDQAGVDQGQLRLVEQERVHAQQPDRVDARGDLHG
jgi:hypothetical protein